jgi:hypothetical protein
MGTTVSDPIPIIESILTSSVGFCKSAIKAKLLF